MSRLVAMTLGVVMLCAMATVPLVMYAREHGWRASLTNGSLLAAMIALPISAVSLLTYGMTGEWW